MQRIKNNPKKFANAYNIAVINDDNAEINMYGEVVSKWPVDWWTQEKVPGNFIAVDEFLKDLEEIKNKSNITININSIGGELNAGLAIYNRIRDLSGNVITINDGLAASAASLIFQAGNTRKMHAGSNLMMHGAAMLLWDYYNVQDLNDIIGRLDAHNNAALNVYAEASGRSIDEFQSLMCKETWLTGQEAVDAGLADEVIGIEPVNMSLSMDKTHLVVNGLSIPTNRFTNIPSGLPVMSSSIQIKGMNINKNDIGGSTEMDIKTTEDLKNAFPELVAQIENNAGNTAMSSGVSQERARIKAIEDIENKIADKELVKNAKYGEKPIDAKDLAFMALQNQASLGTNILSKIDADTKNSGAAEVHVTPNAGNEQLEADNKASEIMNAAIEAFKLTKGNGGTK